VAILDVAALSEEDIYQGLMGIDIQKLGQLCCYPS
jgi:hypothetical protein